MTPMIDFDEIEKEIINMEANRDTSYATMERLAPLYAAMTYKRLCANPEVYEPQAVSAVGDSDFLQAVSDMAPARAWEVMDELMDSLKIVNERVYSSVMRKLEV